MNQVVSGGEQGQGKRPPAEPEIEIIEEVTTPAAAPVQGKQQANQGYEYPEENEGDQGDSRMGAVSGGGATAQQAVGDDSVSKEELSARQRRRQRERSARNAERAELIRLRGEVQDLRGRFDQQDSRIANSEQAGLEGQIAGVQSEIAKATTVMSRAMAAQNSEDFAQALEIRDALRDQLTQLHGRKAAQGGEGADQGQSRQGSPMGMTAQQLQFARIFASRHPWYKHGSQDQDSQMVVQIDNEMTAQGLNPRTPEYWMELERRVREDVPHKYQQAAVDDGQGSANSGNGQGSAGNGRRPGGPKLPGSGNAGGSSNAGGGPTKFHLSAARKQALINLGVWDDPEQRMKHVKRFIQWDKDNASA